MQSALQGGPRTRCKLIFTYETLRAGAILWKIDSARGRQQRAARAKVSGLGIALPRARSSQVRAAMAAAETLIKELRSGSAKSAPLSPGQKTNNFPKQMSASGQLFVEIRVGESLGDLN